MVDTRWSSFPKCMVWFVLSPINKSKSLSGSFRWNAIRAAWNSFHSYFIAFWWLLVREQALLVSIHKTIFMKKERPLILIAMPWYFIHFKNINRAKAKGKIPWQNQSRISMLLISLSLLLCLFSTTILHLYHFQLTGSSTVLIPFHLLVPVWQ